MNPSIQLPDMQTMQAISPEAATKIDHELNKLVANPDITAAIVLGKDGTLLGHGSTDQTLDAASFASVVSGAFSANQTMARLLQDDAVHCMCHHGINHNVLVTDIDENTLLAVVFKPGLGSDEMIRTAESICEKIVHLLSGPEKPSPQTLADLQAALESGGETLFQKK